jgi:aspartate/methionine/tyrosine aminotransferase
MRRRSVDAIDLSCLAAQPSLAVARFVESQSRTSASSWQPASPDDLASLHEAAAHWYEHRFGCALDPDTEFTFAPNAVVGLTFLCLSFIEAGDMVLLPDPGARYYRGAAVLCGGGLIPYYLTEKGQFHPQWGALQASLVGRLRLVVLSSPHNPTTSTIDRAGYSEAIGFARRNQTLLVNDAGFAFASTPHSRPESLLSAPFASGVGVEIASMEANFGFPGLGLALVCGNREAISAVRFLRESSQWAPSSGSVRLAATLLMNGEAFLRDRVSALAQTRTLITKTVEEIGWRPLSAPSVPFIWISVPARIGAEAFCRRMLRRTGVLMSPGTDFGERGEGFVRIVLPEDQKTAELVAERLRRHAKLYQRRLPRRLPLGQRARKHHHDES